MDKTVGISYEENRMAQVLIEKKDALENLAELIKENEQYSEMYKKCTAELEEVCQEYDQWWDNMIGKYQLSGIDPQKLLVDCSRQLIYLGEGGGWYGKI